DKTLTTHLPTKGVDTIYAVIGDSFIVFCLLMFALTGVALKKRNPASLEKQAIVLKPAIAS
ncbi:MAG: hypothetical protein AAFN93_11380, partial [Bacteroidota bacterium]